MEKNIQNTEEYTGADQENDRWEVQPDRTESAHLGHRPETSRADTRKKIRKIWRKLRFQILKMPVWHWLKWLVLVFILMLGTAKHAYRSGQEHAAAEAGKKAAKEAAQYQKEKEELQRQLKEIKIQKPEERPWYLTLVNDTHPMAKDYTPKLKKLDKENSVDERIWKPLKKMLADAEKAGLSMYVCSAYRSVERQQELYDLYMGNAVKKGKTYWEALEETRRGTAYPGRSEHGMGLAVDIISNKYTKLDKKQQETPEAKWLMKNCWKYGFILRYPVDKTDITGIMYEPWHYRYVGVEDAKAITERKITLEEYLGEVH